MAWRIVAGFLALIATAASASAHGIAGNRLFPGTLTFDDPAVADELELPNFSSFALRDDSGPYRDTGFAWSFTRLLTPTIGVGASGGAIWRRWAASGALATSIDLKGQVFRDDAHETLVSSGLSWGVGDTGSKFIGANTPHFLAPGVNFGKGFGDLPDALALLRPFAITGALAVEIPMAKSSTNMAFDPATRVFNPSQTTNYTRVHWGFALEFSTLYLTDRFTGAAPKHEPVNQFVPLVEFAFDTPLGTGQRTKGTINPGLSYVAGTWQVVVEAMAPIDRFSGRSIGVRAQTMVFIDDMFPALFGKPLLGK